MTASEGDLIHPGNAELVVPEAAGPAPVVVSSSRAAWDEPITVAGNLKEAVEFPTLKADGSHENVGRVVFHLVNRQPYHGERAMRHGGKTWTDRASFTFGKWSVTVDSLPHHEDRWNEARG